MFLDHKTFSLIQREIKKEIERRKTGKEMLDYKRKQEEELTKRMLEERNREKAEDRAARERIKQQIALVSLKFPDIHEIVFLCTVVLDYYQTVHTKIVVFSVS